MSLLLKDPWIAATIDKAIAKHGARWSPAQRKAFREQMAFTLETHPRVRAILVLARPALHEMLPPLVADLDCLPPDLTVN